MKRTESKRPPRIPLAIFRFFCNKDWREDMEGDLLERFNCRMETEGIRRARFLFTIDVFLLLISGWMMDNIKHKIICMSCNNWIKLVLINLILVMIVIAPFIPGPPNKLVNGISIFAQAGGLVGLLFIPVAVFWIIFEIRKTRRVDRATMNWKVPYWFAISFLIIVSLLFALFNLAIYFSEGWITGSLVLMIFALGVVTAIRGISRLKLKNDRRFNPTPLYLLTIPVILFLTNLYIVKPASEYSRDLAIKQAEKLIRLIEDYRLKEGRYPESIEQLKQAYVNQIPSSRVMGIPNFRYNKIDDNYSLSFSQWLEWGSLEVLVLYDKYNLRNNLKGRYADYDYNLDLCRVKGAMASFDMKYENWRYYLLD